MDNFVNKSTCHEAGSRRHIISEITSQMHSNLPVEERFTLNIIPLTTNKVSAICFHAGKTQFEFSGEIKKSYSHRSRSWSLTLGYLLLKLQKKNITLLFKMMKCKHVLFKNKDTSTYISKLLTFTQPLDFLCLLPMRAF